MSLLPLRRGGSLPVHRGDPGTQASPIVRIDPWNDFDAMDRIFDSFFRAPFSALGRMSSARGAQNDPVIELYENAQELTAYVYAPGIPQDAFEISITGDTLTIKAERKPLFTAADGTTSHTPWSGLAVSSGSFNASYNLPVEVDTESVQAGFKDGVLTVSMPKTQAAQPKQVKVQVK